MELDGIRITNQRIQLCSAADPAAVLRCASKDAEARPVPRSQTPRQRRQSSTAAASFFCFPVLEQATAQKRATISTSTREVW